MIRPSKRGLLSGVNDLASLDPGLASQWHPSKNGNVNPSQILATTEQKAWWLCQKGHDWEANVRNRHILNSGCPFCSGRRVWAGENDLVTTHPHIASDWHPTKNHPVLPSQVSAGVGKKYWWKCEQGHEWEQSPATRSNQGLGCPFCSGRRVWAGENDLVTTHPHIASDWHPTKNHPVLPSQVSAGVGKKYWWKCERGHEWDESPNLRCRTGRGACPVCTNRRIVVGINDFASRFPELAAMWDEEKNEGRSVESLRLGMTSTFWWLCSAGHYFRSSALNLVNGRGCGVCSGRQVVVGTNDLASTRPDLAEQWDYEKNPGLQPQDVVATTSRFIWWKCEHGHSWKAKGEWRSKSSGCPICQNKTRKPVPGVNDLCTTHPQIAKLWHPTKNEVEPNKVFAGSGEARWWKCEFGHEFRATGYSMVNGVACGVCANRQIQIGVNDMAHTHPELAKQWHPTKNLPLTPESVIAAHSGKLWWVCDEGHEFTSTGHKRASGTRCPFCINQKLLAGYNDLATVNPSIAREWHPTKNGDLTPETVLGAGHRKYWWICDQGHEWRAQITDRLLGTACPGCAQSGFDATQPGILYFISNKDYDAFKIGITNAGMDRLNRFVKAGWQLEHRFASSDGWKIRNLETHLFRWIRGELKLPQYLGSREMGALGGYSETFAASGVTREKVIQKIMFLEAADDVLDHEP